MLEVKFLLKITVPQIAANFSCWETADTRGETERERQEWAEREVEREVQRERRAHHSFFTQEKNELSETKSPGSNSA